MWQGMACRGLWLVMLGMRGKVDYCERCGYAVSELYYVERGRTYHEMCWECHQRFLEDEIDYVEYQMEDR